MANSKLWRMEKDQTKKISIKLILTIKEYPQQKEKLNLFFLIDYKHMLYIFIL